MGMNIGYLTANRTSKADECLTPYYAVEPLIKYISKDKTIWCPFDKKNSAYVKLFKENGYEVIFSHIEDGKDFFEYEPEKYDIIISNPPFSKKDKVLQRCYELNKLFALLLPINCLQGKNRYKYFKSGIELLCFDARIDFHTNNNLKETTKGNHFASGYFCKGILPEKLIIEKLNKYDRSLE